jgi:hypothetical protein
MYVNDEERRATEGIVERLMADELGDGLTARLLGRKGPDEAAFRVGGAEPGDAQPAGSLPPPPGLPKLKE